MSEVTCGCGKKFEIHPSGEGYEEFRNHLRMEARQLSGGQWVEAQHRIKEAEEKKKGEEKKDSGRTG